jgi:hypothetical protein
LREFHSELDEAAFNQLVEKRLKHALDKPFDMGLTEKLGFKKFGLKDLANVKDLLKKLDYSPASLTSNPGLKKAACVTFEDEISLKQIRSGKHEIDGSLYECLRVNVANLIGIMESANGARTFLIRSHMTRFLIFVIEMRKSYSKNLEESSDDFKKYLRETFGTMQKSEDSLMEYDLWVPNFRLSSLADKSLQATWKADKQNSEEAITYFSVQLDSTSDGELIKRGVGDKSIVLKSSFVVGIMDTLNEDHAELPIFAAMVTPDNFVPC